MTDTTKLAERIEALATRHDIEGHLADAIRDTFLRATGKVISFGASSRMAKAALRAQEAHNG